MTLVSLRLRTDCMALFWRRTSAVKPLMPWRLAMAVRVLSRNAADAAVLPLVADDEGHLRPVRLRIEVVAADGDDVFAAGGGQGADDGHFVAVVDVDEVLHLLLRKLFHAAT